MKEVAFKQTQKRELVGSEKTKAVCQTNCIQDSSGDIKTSLPFSFSYFLSLTLGSSFVHDGFVLRHNALS